MTPRKKQTNMLADQPVRFYKIIALSFLLLTIALLAIIVFMSSKRSTITIVTRPEPIDVNADLELSKDSTDGLLASTEVELSKSFKPTADKEIPSIATGEVVLYNKTDYDQPLVATTRLLTSDNILFRLKEKALVPANGSVLAEVYADQKGKTYEIGPSKFTIPGLALNKQSVVYATSEKSMTGGVRVVGILTKEDLEKAEKELVEEAKIKGQAELESDTENMTAAYQITDQSVKTDVMVGEETSEFTMTVNATIVVAFYNSAKLQALADQELSKRVISDAEVVTQNNTKPTLVLQNYDLPSKTANLKLYYSGLVELNPESDQLQKIMFYGKTKDEIRRYLLSLDHVQGVEIKFSPAWMHTVPHVDEHVNVIVKSVE